MLVGMGTVFVFLTALVFATSFMSNLVLRYFPEEGGSLSHAEDPHAEEIAAITAAIHMHRSKEP